MRLALPVSSMSLVCLTLAGSSPTLREAAPAPAVWQVPPPGDGYSNIHRRDYVGAATCAECHPDNHAAWSSHPHGVMNQDAGPETVVGDFDDARLTYAGTEVAFTRADDAYLMTLTAPGERRRYRVTRTVGSRFTQMYIGVQVEGPEPPEHPLYTREGKLPFGWWIARGRWFPEVYFDSDCPPEYDRDGALTLPPLGTHARAEWTASCIYCHNTYAYEDRIRAQRGATGWPSAALEFADGAPPDDALDPDSLVQLGVSCESCHFGGREHVDHERAMRFVPQSPALTVAGATPAKVADARAWPEAVNAICAQCHAAAGVSEYPDGSGTWNSREAADQANGACATAIKCTDCHDPHLSGPPGGSGLRADHYVQSCLRCHADLRDPAARADHTQHPAQVSCLDCHMPRIVQGLEAVVRTHRIRAAPDARMLGDGAPNACNLCHLDRSLDWTLAALRIGWGVDYDPTGWETAYHGGREASVGQAWLNARRPITRLVATSAWARSPWGQQALSALLASLRDPFAVNRLFALFAVERVLGRRLEPAEFDPTADPAAREAQLEVLLRELPAELR